jgi:hypothetical protein
MANARLNDATVGLVLPAVVDLVVRTDDGFPTTTSSGTSDSVGSAADFDVEFSSVIGGLDRSTVACRSACRPLANDSTRARVLAARWLAVRSFIECRWLAAAAVDVVANRTDRAAIVAASSVDLSTTAIGLNADDGWSAAAVPDCCMPFFVLP